MKPQKPRNFQSLDQKSYIAKESPKSERYGVRSWSEQNLMRTLTSLSNSSHVYHKSYMVSAAVPAFIYTAPESAFFWKGGRGKFNCCDNQPATTLRNENEA